MDEYRFSDKVQHMSPMESSTLRELTRARPLAVGILEREFDSAFWNRLDTPLADFCRDQGRNLSQVVQALATMPPEEDSRDWNGKPMYVLVDFLTGNHREFRGRYMPNVGRMLEALKTEFGADPDPIREIISEFNDFRSGFSWHMQEEEEFVFPKILRTEACVRHPDLYPEIFKGSVTMYPKTSLRSHEEAFANMISGLAERLKRMVFEIHQLPMVKDILTALKQHDEGLKAHALLETDELFPRAADMEARLLARAQAQQARI